MNNEDGLKQNYSARIRKGGGQNSTRWTMKTEKLNLHKPKDNQQGD
jgi:hypothetical protein